MALVKRTVRSLIILTPMLLMLGCSVFAPKSDSFGKYSVLPAKNDKEYDFMVSFKLGTDETEEHARKVMEFRAEKLCRSQKYLIARFDVSHSPSESWAPSYTNISERPHYHKAMSTLICNPTKNQLAKIDKRNQKVTFVKIPNE